MKKKFFPLFFLALLFLNLPLSLLYSYHRRPPSPPSPPTILEPQSYRQVPEAQDYATATFSDPWDMQSRKDLGPLISGFRDLYIANGLFSAITTSTDANFWLLWSGYPGSYSTYREGPRHPINTGFYKRFSVKMYLSASSGDTAQIYWFYRRDMKQPRVYNFRVYSGWHIYQLDLPSDIWQGNPIGFRFDPVSRTDTVVKIDWARLTNRPSTGANLQWRDSESGSATVHVDSDRSDYNGSVLKTVNSYNGNNSTTIDTDGLEPGNYYFYLQQSEGNSNYSTGLVTVNKAPTVSIKNPDEAGNSKTWAGMYVKNPWDMHSSRDINRYFNLRKRYFRRGVFSGVNARPRPGDSHFYLNMGRKVANASRFRLLTMRYKYNGTFSLRRGTMSRFGWTSLRNKSWQMSDDIVTYTGWNTITIDLKKIKLNRGRYGWRGWVNRFRFDPHEDGYKRGIYIDYINLREYDRLVKSFPITFSLTDTNDNTNNIQIYRDRDRSFGNGNEALITNLTLGSGSHSWRWWPSRRIRGTYWIYIKANDGLNTTGFYSTGPLRVH